MNKSQLLKKYYDSRSACQVLGGLIKKPELINDKKYVLEEEDFKDNLHRTIYICIFNLFNQGVKDIGFAEIETYLANTDSVSHKRIFDSEENKEWLYKTIEDSNIINFDYHYKTIKKFALLRSYIDNGIEVNEILDVNEVDPNIIKQQRDNFNNLELTDIIRFVDKKSLNAKKRFANTGVSQFRKCGDGSEELWLQMQEEPAYGFNFLSGYMNSLTGAIQKGQFVLHTKDSGIGKTRESIGQSINLAAPYLWDEKQKDFVKNKNGMNNAVLYMGNEMDTYKELEPMIWSFISGVETNKVKRKNLTKDESERLAEARRIARDTNFFLARETDYNLSYFRASIEEYKKEYNICSAFIDYLELTPALMAEYSSYARGMTIREDQVLLYLSKGIKDLAEEFDLSITGYTQTTDEFRNNRYYDQRAVKGARSLPNKADLGLVTFLPIKKEIEKLQPILNSKQGIVKYKEPNVCTYIYKNRGDSLSNVMIWGHQNLGNMTYEDMFVTDATYKQINVDKVWINVLEE